MKKISILPLILLCGCAATQVEKPFVTPVVRVEGNSYCKIARPLTYSREDTPETIASVRSERAKHARVCGKATS
jgi:hypothetical protein